MKTTPYFIALRVCLSFIFLWAFFDKSLGLGFATPQKSAWVHGASPTASFLEFAPTGPFSSIHQAMSGSVIVDYLFMSGLLLIGVALLLGVGLRIAGYSGSLLMLLLWSTHLPPVNNPVIDEHILYIVVLLAIARTQAGRSGSLSRLWSKTALVKRLPFLA